MVEFLNGVTAAGSLAVGLFFLRLFRETRDRFFVLFGLAFWMLALNSLVLIWAAPASEDRHYFYIGRLLAFLLIIAAIIDKNRSSNRSQP
jgi:peptidoglycan/LPS O-acetylase OafA/YrhL